MTHHFYSDTFSHDGKEYDLTKVRILTRDEKAFLLPIRDLIWIFKYNKPDENRVFHAKLRYPLLVAKDKVGRWTVVDGLHRLERYRRRGINVIPVKLVNDEILRLTRVIHK